MLYDIVKVSPLSACATDPSGSGCRPSPVTKAAVQAEYRVNGGNQRDTGHWIFSTPPAAMADDLTAMPRQRPAANWPQAGIFRFGYPAQLCGSI